MHMHAFSFQRSVVGGRSCGARDEDKAPGRPTRRRTRDHLHPETVCIVRWPVCVCVATTGLSAAEERSK